MNSPIGHLTDALLVALSGLSPTVYEDLPSDSRARLERLLNGTRPAHRYARALLAGATAWLYRLKPGLGTSLLERFDWEESTEARELWLGYLLSPGLGPELWLALRPLFLGVISHSAELGDAERQFYGLFAFVLLAADIPIDPVAARGALQRATSAGRSYVVEYWWQHAESATDYGATLYRERLEYLLTRIWPLEKELRQSGASIGLARLAMACGTAFPDAVKTIAPLLTKADELNDVLWTLKDKDHPERFPDATLTLLDAIMGDQIERWCWPDLRAILTRLTTVQPSLSADPRLARLDALLRTFE
ncbi:MAG: hypothetical protein M3Y57_20735 [Acidobacteriota bacterium]|nr:hypothetical protein [Acidobacteriota bacterium]